MYCFLRSGLRHVLREVGGVRPEGHRLHNSREDARPARRTRSSAADEGAQSLEARYPRRAALQTIVESAHDSGSNHNGRRSRRRRGPVTNPAASEPDSRNTEGGGSVEGEGTGDKRHRA